MPQNWQWPNHTLVDYQYQRQNDVILKVKTNFQQDLLFMVNFYAYF